MNAEFNKFAKNTMATHADVVEAWSKSNDILERALASAIKEAVA